ncbi:MAG: AraC family transcriptional regulator [Microthrixaceae bacterium]
MRMNELVAPTIPARYATLVLDAVVALGVSADGLLETARIDPDRVDDPDGRLSLADLGHLLEQAIALTGEPAIGYEIGLGSSVTSHGLVGFGMMSSSSLREAILLGIEFLQLRVPVLSAELSVEGDTAAVSVVETVPLGNLREVLFDMFLVKLVRIGSSLTGSFIDFDDVELWFDYAEPDYYQRLSDRLPRMRFDMGTNEARFDASVLDVPPDSADPLNARLIEQQCRRDLDQLGLIALGSDVASQVRAMMDGAEGGYPTLGEVAERLHTSRRTLKRRLQERGTSFHQLLDDARRARAVRLLTSTTLSVEQIARQLGYADASGFRRAFHGWTDTNPSDFRERSRTVR